MLSAVDFDNEFAFEADEIDNVMSKGVLAAKAMPVQLLLAHCTPEAAFSIGLVFS